MHPWGCAMLWAVGQYYAYLGLAVLILTAVVSAYVLLTPYHEVRLIRAGNRAAACSLGGTVIGLALAVGSAVAHSLSLLDMAVWSVLAGVTQMVVYMAVARLLPGLKTRIVEDDLAHGLFLGAVSIAVGLLNAAALTD
ncbi:MAG: DUF350 domain-containing protein [Magnetospirillum gryphiswaldense]|nr:DUF350 domain-containing protein [Magnetospirillum gryphiswaldense]